MIQGFVINLDRDKEKWDRFQSSFGRTSHVSFNRFSAVDGKQYRETHPPDLTFFAQHFNTNKNIGCFKSHQNIWQHIVDQKLPWAIVCEDDAEPTPQWEEKVIDAVQAMADQPWDVIMLGYHSSYVTQHGDKNPLLFFWLRTQNQGKPSSWIKPNLISPVAFSGTHGYAVSQRGAQTLLRECAYNNGVAVDVRMSALYANDKLNAVACVPYFIGTYGANENHLMEWMLQDGFINLGSYEIKYKHLFMVLAVLLMSFAMTRKRWIVGLLLVLLALVLFCLYPSCN